MVAIVVALIGNIYLLYFPIWKPVLIINQEGDILQGIQNNDNKLPQLAFYLTGVGISLLLIGYQYRNWRKWLERLAKTNNES